MPELKINNQTPHCSKHVLPLVVGGLTITCEDNMELMARYPDNYFDLAIVDPPYGIGGSRAVGTYARKATNYSAENDKKWDVSIPKKEYFKELFRVSKNQIIWGGNYMVKFLPATQGWICWYKTNELKGRDFSEFELAFTSFQKAARHIELRPFVKKHFRIHPTQKPVDLYKFCLDKYAKQGDKILDTHLGSGSIAIACHDYKFELTACELDPEYFEKAKQRILNHVAQQSLF